MVQFWKTDASMWAPFTPNGNEMLSNWQRAQTTVGETFAELAGESSDFVRAQIDAGIDGWAKLGACKSAGDLADFQTQMIGAMRDRYFDYVRQMGDCFLGMAARSARAFDQAGPQHAAEKPATAQGEEKRAAAE